MPTRNTASTQSTNKPMSKTKRSDTKQMKEMKEIVLEPDYEPTSLDIICGRGQKYHHIGNWRLRTIVMLSMDAYMGTVSRIQKGKILDSIIASVKSAGGRFVRRDPEKNCWIEVNQTTARDKVGHSLRDANSERKKGAKRAKGSGGHSQPKLDMLLEFAKSQAASIPSCEIDKDVDEQSSAAGSEGIAVSGAPLSPIDPIEPITASHDDIEPVSLQETDTRRESKQTSHWCCQIADEEFNFDELTDVNFDHTEADKDINRLVDHFIDSELKQANSVDGIRSICDILQPTPLSAFFCDIPEAAKMAFESI